MCFIFQRATRYLDFFVYLSLIKILFSTLQAKEKTAERKKQKEARDAAAKWEVGDKMRKTNISIVFLDKTTFVYAYELISYKELPNKMCWMIAMSFRNHHFSHLISYFISIYYVSMPDNLVLYFFIVHAWLCICVKQLSLNVDKKWTFFFKLNDNENKISNEVVFVF